MMKFPAMCPRCKQGPDLHRVRIAGLVDIIFVCHECDATWLTIEAIGNCPPHVFETYLRENGLDPISVTQEILD